MKNTILNEFVEWLKSQRHYPYWNGELIDKINEIFGTTFETTPERANDDEK